MLHPGTHALIHEYLIAAGHGEDERRRTLFRRPIRNRTTGELDSGDHAGRHGIYKMVRAYSVELGFKIEGAHALRATAASPTRSITRPTLPRCRSGLVTPISPPRRSTDHRCTRPEGQP